MDWYPWCEEAFEKARRERREELHPRLPLMGS
ncbi:MAG: hypothetical protein B7Z74_09820 [Deltaproteobacteria bacterium 21-66-5]|nr:MAG: hypothetical protein B7Z74_09820 [Deltaproteobacteria bacterium 21-66-5]